MNETTKYTIQISNASVMNLQQAIRGMRNPMSSWDKSDSFLDLATGRFVVGPKDRDLAMRLVAAGEPHRKFLRQILVSFDLRAPGFFWTEFDTYKVGVTRDSTSTMHRIMARDLEMSDFDGIPDPYNRASLSCLVKVLNVIRARYLSEKEACESGLDRREAMEGAFVAMKQLLPQSYMYLSTVTLNYEVLANMWKWRHNHRLPHWRTFCSAFVETLPYAEFITGGANAKPEGKEVVA